MLGCEVDEGGGELNEREGLDGVVVDGFGELNERDGELGVVVLGDVDGFGAEKERPPEEKPPDLGAENDLPLAAAKAGVTRMPSTKTKVTARASTRRTQAQGRMVPLPSV